MKNKVLVLQQVDHEGLGVLEPMLLDKGFQPDLFNLLKNPETKIDLKKYQALIVLGGPMGVYDTEDYPGLDKEIEIIREWIKSQKPLLGICLGAQLITKALGGSVIKGEKEIGWYHIERTNIEDSLMVSFDQKETVFQWHGDQCVLPEDCEILASSPLCLVQAFRFGSQVYGFQFHIEVEESDIVNWLEHPDNQADLQSFEGGWKNKICEQNEVNLSKIHRISHSVIDAFLQNIAK